MLPKLVITDIDGVWTDNGMYYDQTGNELKKFNTLDSAGVLFLNQLQIPTVIMTGEHTNIVAKRAEKLKIEHNYMGVKDKVACAQKVCSEIGVEFYQVAFIGNDINDLKLLKKVGLAGCPYDAPEYIKREVDIITSVNGGHGAFREFIETILINNNVFDKIIDAYS